MYFFLAAFQAKGKYNPPCFVIMKAYVILRKSLLAAAIGCALSGCYDPYYDNFSVSGSYSSGSSGVSYMYDSSGYPFTDIMEEDPFMPTTRSEAPFTPST